MTYIDDFLRKIEQKIQNNEKINTSDIHTFANMYAHNCLKDVTIIAKLNLFVIDNKIKLITKPEDTYFEDSFWKCLYYADLAKERHSNCMYQDDPPTERDICELQLKYPNIFEFVPFEKC
jgi:hypothetical protein